MIFAVLVMSDRHDLAHISVSVLINGGSRILGKEGGQSSGRDSDRFDLERGEKNCILFPVEIVHSGDNCSLCTFSKTIQISRLLAKYSCTIEREFAAI